MLNFLKKDKEISSKEDYDMYLKKANKQDVPYGFNNKHANQE